MMMPMVFGDRPLIIKIPREPGKAEVLRGGNPKEKPHVSTMTVGQAEVLEANYIRPKFGLEPLGKDVTVFRKRISRI
jgi:hypothetical protein